jgi:hypothetical protein
MPIPTAGCADDIPSDVCCDTIWLVGDRIRTVATAGLMDCIDPTCSDREFRSFSTWGERIEEPLGEALIVSWVRNRIGTRTSAGAVAPFSVTQAEFRVELHENGWPVPDRTGDNIVLPDSALINAVSKHATGHAERMWRAVVNAAQRQIGAAALFALPANEHIIHGSTVVGDLTPIGPDAYRVGARFNVTVEMKLQ